MTLFHRLYDDVLLAYEVDTPRRPRTIHVEGNCGNCPLQAQCKRSGNSKPGFVTGIKASRPGKPAQSSRAERRR